MILNTSNMFKLIVLALLVISHLGDATSKKNKLKRDLEVLEDKVAKELYEKALIEARELTVENTEICGDYDKHQIRVTVFSKVNPHGHKINVDVEESLKNSTFDVKKPTKIIVSPEHMHINSSELVAAYLRHHSGRVNVITVHYEKFFGCNYVQFVQIYNDITFTIAQLVKMLHVYGTVLDQVHMIGFGMSSHLIGATSDILHPYQVGRITGLDPAGEFFDKTLWLGQLNADDADFVDIISTNTAKYGTRKERGTVHFYPNGGERQPGDDDDLRSHLKALKYFIESIVRPGSFKSYRARTWSDFMAGNVSTPVTYMGEYVSIHAHGSFFNKVNPLPPFSVDGKGDVFNEQVSYGTRGQLFEMTQKALKKEAVDLEKLGQQVIVYTSEDVHEGRHQHDAHLSPINAAHAKAYYPHQILLHSHSKKVQNSPSY